jgi:hypothetical protein
METPSNPLDLYHLHRECDNSGTQCVAQDLQGPLVLHSSSSSHSQLLPSALATHSHASCHMLSFFLRLLNAPFAPCSFKSKSPNCRYVRNPYFLLFFDLQDGSGSRNWAPNIREAVRHGYNGIESILREIGSP